MVSNQPAPLSLKVVAGLFILGGICSAIEVVLSLMHGHISINFGVLGLFIGTGLLRFSRGWRTCALVFLWIALIGVPIVALMFLTVSGQLDFVLFGQKAGHVSVGFALVTAAVAFVLALWQYRVLNRPDIRKLFGVDNG